MQSKEEIEKRFENSKQSIRERFAGKTAEERKAIIAELKAAMDAAKSKLDALRSAG